MVDSVKIILTRNRCEPYLWGSGYLAAQVNGQRVKELFELTAVLTKKGRDSVSGYNACLIECNPSVKSTAIEGYGLGLLNLLVVELFEDNIFPLGVTDLITIAKLF